MVKTMLDETEFAVSFDQNGSAPSGNGNGNTNTNSGAGTMSTNSPYGTNGHNGQAHLYPHQQVTHTSNSNVNALLDPALGGPGLGPSPSRTFATSAFSQALTNNVSSSPARFEQLKIRQLAAAVVRLWAETFKGNQIFEIIKCMGRALEEYAERLERGIQEDGAVGGA
jgi:hypothetical protein